MTNDWRDSSSSGWANPNDSGTFCIDPLSENDEKPVEKSREDLLLEEWIEKLKRMPKVRLDRIRRIKDEIDNGTYYSEAKWKTAVERLAAEFRDES